MKPHRTIAEIPANRVACYEWKDVEKALPAKDSVVCASVPKHPNQRAIAIFDGEHFLWIETRAKIEGVTFWCHAPMTPEDLDAEAKAEKKQATAEPDLFA